MNQQKFLIDNLVKTGYLKTPIIIEAFNNVDRKDFVLEEFKADAYFDTSLSIGYGQTISQPLTISVMLEMLQPRAGDKILEIGFGSGYVTALLAYCVSQKTKDKETKELKNNKGKIFAIERIRKLYEFGLENVSRYNFIKKGIVKFYCQDGSGGLSQVAPFDRIIAAAAADTIPSAFKKQIKIGGRIVMPIKEDLIMLEKQKDNSFRKECHHGFTFVPLVKF